LTVPSSAEPRAIWSMLPTVIDVVMLAVAAGLAMQPGDYCQMLSLLKTVSTLIDVKNVHIKI